MARRIRLRFPETGKLLQKFLESLSTGILTIPTSQVHPVGEELEVDLVLPELSEPQKIMARIKAVNPDGKSVEVTITNREEVDKILDRLAEIPSYNELLDVPGRKKAGIEEAEEIILKVGPEDQEGPEAQTESETVLSKALMEEPGSAEPEKS